MLMSLNYIMDKKYDSFIQWYTKQYTSNKKEWCTVAFYNMEEPWKHMKDHMLPEHLYKIFRTNKSVKKKLNFLPRAWYEDKV